MTWSSKQYLKFEDERTRPARDLLNAVPTFPVRRAADLGCGPGNSTELIASRWPEAEVIGVDTSPEMLKTARARLPRLRFELQSVQDWSEAGLWDLLFANAVLQWVPDHETLLPRLASLLSPTGSLAIQMPDNLNEPSHVAMRTVASMPSFARRLEHAARARTTLSGADWYYGVLRSVCSRIDIWRTTYYHTLTGGVEAIVEWVKGTGLLPFLKPLTAAEQSQFLDAYREEIAKVYKPMADGVVMLPFPRLFIVAVR